jgi:hypothetical protein
VTNHHDQATERIQAYYENPEKSPFDVAPHDQQLQKAAQYLEFTVEEILDYNRGWAEESEDRSIEWLKRRSWSRSQLADLVFGIALELLVSGIHLKLDPDEYVSHLCEKNQTPHINESKSRLIEDLTGKIKEEHVCEVSLVLDLAKKKRDNLVHFGFHYQGAHYYPSLFIDAGGFLIARYADTDDIPELASLAKYRTEYDQGRTEAEYPELGVSFEPIS